MKRGGGKNKGSSFERKVCVMLSLYVTAGKRDDIFWRSAMSGGRSTGSIKRGGQQLAHVAGDICAVHPDGAAFVDKFFVECKHYRDMQVGRAVLTGDGKLVEFFKVAYKKAAELGKDPVLIFKQDRSPMMVASTMFGFDALDWISSIAINSGVKNQALSGPQAMTGTGSILYLDHAEAVFDPKRNQPARPKLRRKL